VESSDVASAVAAVAAVAANEAAAALSRDLETADPQIKK
jgi:hypothetical protein